MSRQTSAKALYLRARANAKRGSLEEAQEDLTHAAKLEPDNRQVREELGKVRRLLKDVRHRERQMFKGAFGDSPASPTPTSAPSTESTPRAEPSPEKAQPAAEVLAETTAAGSASSAKDWAFLAAIVTASAVLTGALVVVLARRGKN